MLEMKKVSQLKHSIKKYDKVLYSVFVLFEVKNLKNLSINELELDLVLKKLKNKKASKLDGIPPKVWKTRKFNDLLLYYCNEVYNGNVIHSWTEGCILPFSKNIQSKQKSGWSAL